MIVNRRTFNARAGHWEDAVQWLQREIAAEAARGDLPGKTRVYVCSIGQFDQVAFESEYESLAVYEKFWATWFARPTSVEAIKEWQELIRPGGTNEIWDLVE